MVYIQITPHPVFGRFRVVVKTIFWRVILTGRKRVHHNLHATNKLRRPDKNPPADRLEMLSFDKPKAPGDMKINWLWHGNLAASACTLRTNRGKTSKSN